MITVFHQNHDATFTRVAKVYVSGLETAYQLTNNIDHAWVKNMAVYPYVEKARSSSVGDIFYDHRENRFYRVASFGFEAVADDGQLILTFSEFAKFLN